MVRIISTRHQQCISNKKKITRQERLLPVEIVFYCIVRLVRNCVYCILNCPSVPNIELQLLIDTAIEIKLPIDVAYWLLHYTEYSETTADHCCELAAHYSEQKSWGGQQGDTQEKEKTKNRINNACYTRQQREPVNARAEADTGAWGMGR